MGNPARADGVCGYPRNRSLYRKHLIMKHQYNWFFAIALAAAIVALTLL
jgi:hypothetical protein